MPDKIGYGPGPGASKDAAQHRSEQEGTPTEKPISRTSPNRLESNTLLGKFEGHKSEAK